MLASQTVTEQCPDAVTSDMSASMEAHAANGNWEKVEELAAKLRAAVMHVPEQQRRFALLAMQRSLKNVQALAQYARNDVTDKLSAIRRGKDATIAYGTSTGTESVLRAPQSRP